jgi:hypothetical protein
MPSTAAPPTSTYGAPTASFDPYLAPPNPYGIPPSWNLSNWFNPSTWGTTSAPVIPLGPASYPTYINPSSTANPYAAPSTTSAGAYPPGVYPNTTPNVLYPGTSNQPWTTNWNYSNPYGSSWWNSTYNNLGYSTTQTMRCCQGLRFRHTWLSGTDGFKAEEPNSLEINDTDVSLVFAIPNFFNSTRALYIIPSYSHHLWDGPSVPGVNLPSNAFSGFLDVGWDTNPMKTLGVELGFRVGVFSDFDAISEESIRYQGKAIGRLRLTPACTFKFGVFYLDRNKIKLLPAGGLLWSPNQDTRMDIFFPEPKLSHYVSTCGTADVWWYLSAYYGGGAWTIQQPDGANDDIDINDIRVMLGVEFGRSAQIRQGYRLGFFEGGYAFNRELLYRYGTSSDLDLKNSLVLRAGFAY